MIIAKILFQFLQHTILIDKYLLIAFADKLFASDVEQILIEEYNVV